MSFALRAALGLVPASLAALALTPAPAWACGGFFCGGPVDPVIQTKEGIMFTVDPGKNEVTAIINIAYQGNPAEFAWLLPLQVAPSALDVSPVSAFVAADNLTAPQFYFSSYETTGVCAPSAVLAAEDSAAGFNNAPPAPRNNTEVLDRKEVGPYDTVTLRGTDPEAVRRWLTDNGFFVTDQMMEAVVPYIAKGDVLLALKLLKDSSVGEIQPIRLVLPGTSEACIPLRMTAIAAQADMDITAFVFTRGGRAVPDNYFHVELNLAKIDWRMGGNNYRQIVSEAADEGEGNAFTTEYAGKSSIFERQIHQPEAWQAFDGLRQHRMLVAFLRGVQEMGIQRRPDVRRLLTAEIPELNNCGSCNPESIPDRVFDPTALLDKIQDRIIRPEQETQALIDGYTYLTRLYTLISPEEMGVDPIFSYRTDLPEVSNRHSAKLVAHCGVGGEPGSAGVDVILENGQIISYKNMQDTNREVLDQMPAALRVEQLARAQLVVDNSDAINDLLDRHNSESSGCGCSSAEERRSWLSSLGLLALLGAARVFLRKRA